jgi:hypothetical protein
MRIAMHSVFKIIFPFYSLPLLRWFLHNLNVCFFTFSTFILQFFKKNFISENKSNLEFLFQHHFSAIIASYSISIGYTMIHSRHSRHHCFWSETKCRLVTNLLLCHEILLTCFRIENDIHDNQCNKSRRSVFTLVCDSLPQKVSHSSTAACLLEQDAIERSGYCSLRYC